MKVSDLYSLTLTKSERDGLDSFVTLALTIRQQLNIRKSHEQEKESH